MSKTTTKEVRALLETASEMFDETGCVPGIDGEEVRAETMVPDVKEYISESIDNPDAYIAKGYSKGVMPTTFGQSLSSTQLNDLVAFILSGTAKS